MLPLEDGGVVDNKLKVVSQYSKSNVRPTSLFATQVHKTTNIRIADLSVVPLHIASHTQCQLSSANSENPKAHQNLGTAVAYTLAEIGKFSFRIIFCHALLTESLAADIIKGKI